MFRIPRILCSVMRPSFQSRVSPTYVRLLQARKISFIRDHVYFEKAVAQGAGRDGSVKSFGDAPLDLKMSAPHIVGGKGHGHNPEQLFAMGLASCFLGALRVAAARAGRMELAENARITATVFIGRTTSPIQNDGFSLRVEIDVEGCDDDAIIGHAHGLCPYSRMMEGGAEIIVTKS